MRHSHHMPFAASGLSVVLGLTGCGRAPSFNILGSYFPSWLVCILIGILGSCAVNVLLTHFQRSQWIRWTLFVYPCIAASIACTLWIFLFS